MGGNGGGGGGGGGVEGEITRGMHSIIILQKSAENDT